MSGHSKWHSIKHKKGALDAKRGKLFTKLIRELTVSARVGGGDPDNNSRLRKAIADSKAANMPNDTIQRAIDRGTGKLEGEQYEEVIYEGYGPGGGAILLQVLTTNRNRTAAEVRSTFSRGGGSLGESGCVAWNFETKGVVTVEVDDEGRADELSLVAIDAGAEDIKYEDGILEIYTTPEKLPAVQSSLTDEGVTLASSDISLVPKTTIGLDGKAAEQTLKLLDTLEELLDVQKVYSNADFPDEVLERYGKGG